MTLKLKSIRCFPKYFDPIKKINSEIDFFLRPKQLGFNIVLTD